MSTSGGPTIVLIGGEATLDSGAEVDSRQPLQGDKWDVVLRHALSTSEAWWSLAKSFVDLVLAQCEQADAWALAWVDKTLKRPRADGTFVRVRPKTFLDGAENLIAAGTQGGPARFRSDAVTSRYRTLAYLSRFDDLQGGPPPTVIVGGFHTTYDDGTDIVGDRPLDYFTARWPHAVIVLPHTPIVEAKARRILQRRPATTVGRIGVVEQTHPAESRRYVAALERIEDLHRADSYVLSHDFHITFWADKGALQEAADLDAALTFVKSRYDLNLGLWDLARDPALRETLLQREDIAQPANAPAAVPEELAIKAREKATTRQQDKEAELAGRHRHHGAIWPALSRMGWQHEGVDYRLAAGPLVPSLYSEGYEKPALCLSLGIQKRQAVLELLETARTGRTEQFLRTNSELIATITGAPPDDSRQVVWRIAGKGWAGSAEGWPEVLRAIERLAAGLAPQLKELGEAAARERTEQLKSSTVEITIGITSRGAEVVEKKSMWDRLRGRTGQ